MNDEPDSEPAPHSVYVSAGLAPGSGTAGDVRIVIRNYLSSYLLWTSMHMAELAAVAEANHGSDALPFDLAHRGYVLAAITAATAFLEAMVNELFQDAADGHTSHPYVGPFEPEVRARMALRWRETNDGRTEVLAKFDMLLEAATKSPLDHGARPYQDVDLLIDLRNTVVHYRPKDVGVDLTHSLDRLRGKFPANATMAGSANPWWPDHCLGGGCARWAASTAEAFADVVVERLGIEPNYRRLRADGWMGQPPTS